MQCKVNEVKIPLIVGNGQGIENLSFHPCVGGYYEKRALMCQTCMPSQALFPPPICQYLKNNFINNTKSQQACNFPGKDTSKY